MNVIFRKRVFAVVIKMMSCWTRVDHKSNDWCSYKVREIWRHTGTQGRWPRDDRDRGRSGATTSQGTPRAASNHRKTGERHRTVFVHTPLGSFPGII